MTPSSHSAAGDLVRTSSRSTTNVSRRPALRVLRPRLGDHVQLYAGIGPAMVVEYNGDAEARFGMAVTAGSYLWLSQNWGFFAEFDYHLLGHDGARNQLGANAGFAFGW